MTDILKPYPEYKDSRVEWLGNVPAHWEVLRLRNAVDMRMSNVDKHSKENEQPVRLCNYVDVYKHDRIRTEMQFMKATATEEQIDCYRLRENDVLITKDSESWDDIGVPALVESSAPDLISGYHLAILRPRQQFIQGSYLFRSLQSRPVSYQLHVEAKGVTRYGLSHHGIKSCLVPLPPLPEQIAIVRFLDYVERRIRKAIRLRQKRIKLLEEYKQALIHHAVTGRIDVRTGKPYPEYKDSGVEWLGQVPAHWEVRRLKTLCSMKSGESITAESIEAMGSFPVFGGNGLRGYTERYTHEGDFVLIGRQGAQCGNVHIARGCFWASEHAVVTTVRGEHLVEWLGALLTAMNLNQYSIAAAQPGLAIERITNISVPVPPLPEQTAIVRFLDEQTEKIDRASDAAHREIELLEEFRTRLIADVVTGKLDVREAAEKLPDSLIDDVFYEEDLALSDHELGTQLEQMGDETNGMG